MRSIVPHMFASPTRPLYTPATMRVGAQILRVVYQELRSAAPEDVGTALSIVLASTPQEVRQVFERRYAEDRLALDAATESVDLACRSLG